MKKVFRALQYVVMTGMIILLSCHFVQASQMPYLWKGIRPLGMGGAFTAIADDYNALFYNPAGLDKIPHWSFAVLNPIIEIGENGQDLYNDIDDTDFDNTTEVIDLLRQYVGERQHAKLALFPHYVMKHFGLGVLGQTSIDTEVNNLQYPEVDTTATIDFAGVGGVGFGLLENHDLHLGLSAKYIRRQQLQETYTAIQISSPDFEDTVEDDLEDGSGFGLDLGALYTFPHFLKPTVGLVIQNIGGIDLGDAGEISQQVNLGTAIHYERGIYSINAALDLVDIFQEMNDEEDYFFRRLHMGVESWIWNRLALRLGLYQGYGTIGASLNLWILKLDYANYAEELGAYSGQRADRRHIVQISLGW